MIKEIGKTKRAIAIGDIIYDDDIFQRCIECNEYVNENNSAQNCHDSCRLEL